MFDFEKLHKNHKWAFVDGLLCGLAIAWYIKTVRDAGRTFPEPPGTCENASEDTNNVYNMSDHAEQR